MIGDWSTSLAAATITPSSGTRSPGFTKMCSPGDDRGRGDPLRRLGDRPRGLGSDEHQAAIARRARSTLRASRRWASERHDRRCAFAPLADDHGSRHRHRHERVHVQAALLQPPPARARDGGAADEDGGEVERDRRGRRGQARQRPRHGQGQRGDRARGPWRRRGRGPLRAGAKAEAGQRALDLVAVDRVDDGRLAGDG